MRKGQLLVINLASVPRPELMRRAQEVARALGQELFVACILDDAELPPALPGRRERVRKVRKKLVARCKNALEKVLDDLNAAGVAAHGNVSTAWSVKEAALELIRKLDPSFVLICRKQHSRIEEAMLSGTDFAIIRACPVPVWVVNPEHRSGDKIVGAIEWPEQDGTRATLEDMILDNTSELAQKLGKEDHALHTFGQAGLPQTVEPAAADPDDDMGSSRYDRRMRKVFAFGKAHGLPRERIHIHEGKLVTALEEMSEPMNADLIVLGASRRGRLRRMLSASAAERIVQRVKADVLILKGGSARAAELGGRAH